MLKTDHSTDSPVKIYFVEIVQGLKIELSAGRAMTLKNLVKI